MPIIQVVKAFMLKDDKHKLTEYKPGRYEVDRETADHWYVKAHLEGFIEPPPKVGTQQQAELLAAQASRLAEPADAQGQPPAESPATERAPEIRFAGRRPPRQVDPGMTSFIDPSTLGRP